MLNNAYKTGILWMLWCGSAMKSFAFSFGFCHFVVGQTKNQHHTQFIPLKSTVSISINIVIHHTPPQCIKHCKLTKCGTSNHFRLLVVLFCFNCGCKSCFVAWKTYRSKTCNYMLNSTCNYVFMEFVHEMNSPENLFCLPISQNTKLTQSEWSVFSVHSWQFSTENGVCTHHIFKQCVYKCISTYRSQYHLWYFFPLPSVFAFPIHLLHSLLHSWNSFQSLFPRNFQQNQCSCRCLCQCLYLITARDKLHFRCNAHTHTHTQPTTHTRKRIKCGTFFTLEPLSDISHQDCWAIYHNYMDRK